MIVRPCSTQAPPHANLRAPRLRGQPIPQFSVQQIRQPQARQHQNIADAFVEFAWPRSAGTFACTRARTPRKRTHTQPDYSSPVTQTLPQLRPQNHLPPHGAHKVPPSYCARLFSLQLSFAKPLRSTSRALTQSNSASHRCWRTALAAGQCLGSPRRLRTGHLIHDVEPA